LRNTYKYETLSFYLNEDGDERMKFREMYKFQEGVAGVIEALLLVALFSIILSTIQLVYIPDIMEQKEVEHMDEVENQFSYLKSVIDLQSSVRENIPISSPITLGSRELPYFVTARAFGQLDIDDSGNSKINTDYVSNIPLTSIKYQAANSYFIDQYYILEGGGLIVKQHDGESMRIEPSISYQNQTNQIRIFWTLPEFDSIAGKNSTSGFKSCYIRSNYSSNTSYGGSTSYIRIFTEYFDAWNNSLNQLFDEAVSNGFISIHKDSETSPTFVEIEPKSKSIYLDLQRTKILLQIGPGIVLQS
jgi:hypothetical protein